LWTGNGITPRKHAKETVKYYITHVRWW
jgi:hypothetical protein